MMNSPDDVVIHPQRPAPSNDGGSGARRVWHSCCLICDRDVVVFVSKVLFSASILCWSMWSIAVETNDCKDMGVYFGLIGMVAGSVVESGSARMMPKRE